ncbi:MAG: dTDP-4-dehydrorhamnose reductase [Alphaproteobacteria bacterium]|nr:dTDP-4-dehydrorhamnose reductase [Alphaproteobacteria bacterium]
MTILVFGKTGQVAQELQRRDDVIALSRAEADLMDPAVCAAIIAAADVSAVVNVAAFTDVDGAEQHAAAANTVNGEAPAVMAAAAAKRGLPFIHISSDYVFDGSGLAPWRPNSPTAPLGAYGRSKLLGEQGIVAAGGQSVIIRTSWVFSAHGKNFVKTMLRLAADRTALNIVADQIGGPTPAADIASAIRVIASQMRAAPELRGIFQYAGDPDVSWADFARAIFKERGLGVTVNDIPSAAYPTPARRPLNSRLDCSSTKSVFGLDRPDWYAGLKTVLAEIG